MRKPVVIILFLATLLFSCKDTREEKIIHLLNEWNGKTIRFPQAMNLISYLDTTNVVKFGEIKKEYTILHYVDTIGCVSCKLRLSEWNKLIGELDSISNHNVNCLISFFPMRKKELLKSLKINKFKHYVYIDEKDSLNQLNCFPEGDAFRTFLLDRDDKVMLVGNPINNPNIKELYLSIIQKGNIVTNKDKGIKHTKVTINQNCILLGNFDWKDKKVVKFLLKNSGDNPLVIQDVTTSCSCTTATFTKDPIAAGEETEVLVTYQAEQPESFYREINVFCNTEDSPVLLEIKGNAQ